MEPLSPEEQQKTDVRFMQEALKQAHEAFRRDEVPIGAVVVCEGKIIGKGYNSIETLKDATAHAEMLAFTSAASYLNGKYLTDCTLYVTLEPCTMCAGAAFWTQIPRIVYGARDEKRGFIKATGGNLHPKAQLQGGILAEECRQLILQFFASKR